MGNLTRIAERVAAPFSGSRVDREAGVIRGALVCGTTSANGNDYNRESFGDGTQYEGRPVYADHGKDRRVADKVGWFENITFRADGRPQGDFHVLKSHPLAPSILEAAERNPALFGFSHVALCKTSRGKNGRTKVEAVQTVESIDLVAEPATTKGIFEGKTVGQISLKTFTERAGAKYGPTTWGGLQKLCEEMGDMADMPAVDEPLADAGAGPGDLKAALMQALAPFMEDAFDTGNSDKLIAAAKDFVKMHAKHTGTGKDDTSDDDTDTETDDDMKESKQASADQALTEAYALIAPELLREAKILAAAKAAGTPAEEVAALAADLKKLRESRQEPTKVTSAGRKLELPKVSEAKTEPGKLPARITLDD
jgi:hypothetical protein